MPLSRTKATNFYFIFIKYISRFYFCRAMRQIAIILSAAIVNIGGILILRFTEIHGPCYT